MIASEHGQSPSAAWLWVLAIAALTAGCFDGEGGAGAVDPGDEHERGAIAVTHFTDRTELFVEFPQLIVGEESPFAAHLTDLVDFKPLLDGTVTAVLSSVAAPVERFSVSSLRSPGIFRPIVVPSKAGEYELSIEVEAAGFSAIHDLGEVTVYNDAEEAAHDMSAKADGGISFLKEQQWQLDFATAPVATRTLRRSLPATGLLRPAANAESVINAPTGGTVYGLDDGYPSVGETVTRGQRLAVVAPRLGSSTDAASLQLARESAAADFALAQQELERLEGLLAQEAVAERRVLEARAVLTKARAELHAAEQRMDQLRRTLGTGTSGVALLAPIDGTLVEVHQAEGAYVDEGVTLFRVVDTSRIWLEARIAEAEASRLGTPTGARFRVTGFPDELEIRPGDNGRLISVGRVVDPVRRTLSVVFELDEPQQRLPVGAHAAVRLLSGERSSEVAVPELAVVDDGGQTIVFVQTGGESFERRVVELGFRDGGFIQVTDGLAIGERIVSRGAYMVRLAAASPAEAGAGHTH